MLNFNSTKCFDIMSADFANLSAIRINLRRARRYD